MGTSKTTSATKERSNPYSGFQRVDGSTYTLEDASHFDRLNDVVGHCVRPFRLETEDFDTVPQTPAIDYTQSDARAFDSLMAELDGVRSGHHGQTANQRGSGQSYGYTNADNALFSEFMSADRFPVTNFAPNTDPVVAPDNGASAFRFTDRDDEEFQKILSGTSARSKPDGNLSPDHSWRRDRDVGPLRIIDFDEEHSRARENKQRGNLNIKVRYFD